MSLKLYYPIGPSIPLFDYAVSTAGTMHIRRAP
jgi:hypothetical protein